MSMGSQGTLTDAVKEDASGLSEIIVLAIRECACADTWSIAEPSPGGEWIVLRHQYAHTPTQGWKLHLSATTMSACEVLRRALPILLAEAITFKVAASVGRLHMLNTGLGGLSQIGKFITVYPNDDVQAVRLATELDQVTRGLDGPSVPSDRAFMPSSLVHYRYGSFDHTWIQLATGQIVPALRSPGGELVADQRMTVYAAPDWVVDPFAVAVTAASAQQAQRLVGGRYLPIATLHRSSRGIVSLSIDCEQPRRCVLKQAARAAASDSVGHDAQDRLRHEAAVLRRLAPEVRAPALLDLVEDGDLFLVLEDIAGETLDRNIAARRQRGQELSVEQIIDYGHELAVALSALHRSGLIYRDLKSSNIIVAADGHLRLIDFELAYDLNASGPLLRGGTRGYMSPQQTAGLPPTPSDDVYSLGGVLFLLATGAEPALAPDPNVLRSRPIHLLNSVIPAALCRVIERCLEPDPARRIPSMDALDNELRRARSSTVARTRHTQANISVTRRERYRTLALGLGATLCATAHVRGQSVTWLSYHPGIGPVHARDLNRGSAGVVLALAELVAVYDEPRQRATLATAADWLRTQPDPAGTPLPGLYIGEAGIGTALLRASQVLGDMHLTSAAAERGPQIAALPHRSPDLFNGTAGRLRFHLWLYDALRDSEHLRAAISAGEHLIASAEVRAPGELAWTIPSGYQRLSGQAYLGYAHGAAGIGDALLDLFEASGDERFLAAARGALSWLERLAQPVLNEANGLSWPAVEGESLTQAYWCHGAAGIGRFFLHAAALDVWPSAASCARRAAHTVVHLTRSANPTQCHGLAGSIEFLLDMFQITGEPQYLGEAAGLARLLEAFIVKRDGLLLCSSEQPTLFSPDYMVGYGGVAVCLLRLADPQIQAPLLSRCGLRQRSQPHNGMGGHDP